MRQDRINIAYVARDYAGMLEELGLLVRSTRPNDWTDFSQSSLGMTLMQFVATMTDIVSYGQDAAANEFFLSTCRRYESALRFARSVGYRVRGSSAARVRLTSESLPESVVAYGATIAAGSTIDGPRGTSYEVEKETIIEAGSVISLLDLIEGKTYTETFSGTAQPDQTITTERGVVEDDSWTVYVGPVLSENIWTRVDNLVFENTGRNVYETSFDGNGKLVIRFGNGSDGAIPSQTITVKYRTTTGSNGNVPVFSIRGSLQATLNNNGSVVSLTYENSSQTDSGGIEFGAATGGQDRETLNELRKNIPAYIATNDRIVTLDDYNNSTIKVPGVALVFADVLVGSFNVNAVRVNAWTNESVTFSGETYKNDIVSVVPYKRYKQLPQNQIAPIRAYLAKRTPVTVHSIIARPPVAYVDLYLSDIQVDESVDRSTVHKNVTEAVVGVFESNGGFVVRLSDVYGAIEVVPGVRNFQIDRIVLDYFAKNEASGSIQFVAQPFNGDYLAIDDGRVQVVFEFNRIPVVAPGRRRVAVGPNIEATAQNFIRAVSETLNITAYRDPVESATIVRLRHNVAGDVYNQPITGVVSEFGGGLSVLTWTGMTGGSDSTTRRVEDWRRDMNPSVDRWLGNTTLTRVLVSESDTTIKLASDPLAGETALSSANGYYAGAQLRFISGPLAGYIYTVTAYTGLTQTVTVTPALPENPVTGSLLQLETRDYVVGSPSDLAESNQPWKDAGILPYGKLKDIVVPAVAQTRNYYDETYLFNNEIYYDSGVNLSSDIQALNLRRLIFGITAR